MSFSLEKFSYFREIKQTLVSFFVTIFTIIGIFGIYACAGAAMDMSGGLTVSPDEHAHHGAMQTECFLTFERESCGVSVLDHVAHWLGTFVFSPIFEIFLSFVFAVVVFAWVVFKRVLNESTQTFGLERYKLYRVHHPDSILYNSLQQFFSAGILHPQIYS